jgi:hypothetical protein
MNTHAFREHQNRDFPWLSRLRGESDPGRATDLTEVAGALPIRRNSGETLAIYAASQINQLRKSSSAASHACP